MSVKRFYLTKREPGIEMHAYNPSIWKVEAVRSKVVVSLGYIVRSCPKTEGGRGRKGIQEGK